MIQAIQPQILPYPSNLCTSVWHQKPTVDISLLLKPKDDEESQPTDSPISTSHSDQALAGFTSRSGRPPYTPLSTVPTKRHHKSGDHAVDSPAKKQSKWSPEEDAKIIQLRGDGMKWEDISKHLPGRSAISCRLHYQNYLERRSEWDEDRKNKLARLYERFKADMWSKIAEEMAIPWRAAEAMHWQMGEQDMARRAGVTPFSLTNPGSNTTLTTASRSTARHSNSYQHRRGDSGSHSAHPQLPSLSELTAGLSAYAAPPLPPATSAHHSNASYSMALTPPLYSISPFNHQPRR